MDEYRLLHRLCGQLGVQFMVDGAFHFPGIRFFRTGCRFCRLSSDQLWFAHFVLEYISPLGNPGEIGADSRLLHCCAD